MLNISPNSVDSFVDKKRYKSMKIIDAQGSGNVFKRLLISFSVVFVILLFIPWTQNIRSKGNVTTIYPDQRPQTIQSIIAGRVDKWFVREGDFVAKGDTILYITEIKADYLDPALLDRTQQQIDAKTQSVESYRQKEGALNNQVSALQSASKLKIQQANNKVRQGELKIATDSMSLEAGITNVQIARKQFDRMEKLYEDGLKSRTDFEKRQLDLQKAEAELIEKENKLLTSRNELINAQVELMGIQAEYQDKISKAQSEKFTAQSSRFDAEATVTKLQNQFMNYSARQGLYYVTAPQDGFVTRTLQAGLGENLKEGDEIVSIMPADHELSVEMYVRPVDLPLIRKGEKVRIQFDGWPAIIFSGWPSVSYGAYGGEVFAIDRFISTNGMYRILVKQDEDDHPWPDALQVGSGTRAMIMLGDVPIWYELWRQINGFPPDFYEMQEEAVPNKKKK